MATQIEIANHLDMSVTRLKEVLPKLSIAESSDIDAVRIAYINHLRNMAAGRGGENHQERLAKAKSRESELKGDKLEMEMARDAGLLVPADEVEKEWASLITAARAELLAMSAKLKDDIKAQFDIDVPEEFIKQYVNAALEHLADSHQKDAEEDLETIAQ
jgi:hypothetical protein